MPNIRPGLYRAPPVPVLAGVVTKVSGAAEFDLAHDGTLVYVAGEGPASGLDERTLVWVDRQGNEVPLDLPARGYHVPRVSPDGIRLVMAIQAQGGLDVWISALTRGTLAILTTDPATDTYGLWTPDGERVVFYSQREAPGLFWVAADGSGEVEPLMTVDGAGFLRPNGWSLMAARWCSTTRCRARGRTLACSRWRVSAPGSR